VCDFLCLDFIILARLHCFWWIGVADQPMTTALTEYVGQVQPVLILSLSGHLVALGVFSFLIDGSCWVKPQMDGDILKITDLKRF